MPTLLHSHRRGTSGPEWLSTRRAMVQRAVDNLTAALGFGPQAGRPSNPVTAKKTTAITTTGAIAGAGKAATGKRPGTSA